MQIDYTSIFLKDSSRNWSAYLDMELAQITFSLKIGIPNEAEIGFEQPIYYPGGGFMDQMILDYHSAFGFPDYPGQRTAPRNRFLYYVYHNGKLWNAPTPYRFTIGDTDIWIKKKFLENDIFAASLKLMAQPPVADTSSGFGNGSWETAAILILNATVKNIEATVNAGIVAPSYIDRGDKYILKRYWVGHASFAYKLKRQISLIAQASIATSPFESSAPASFGSNWTSLTMGLIYTTASGKIIRVGLLEDLSKTAPDFTLHLSVSF